ncbi:toxin-antitoxin system, toxin component [Kribbella qitaiheensis]|uniref:LppU/SCO3897 family protein n=1 Tax=Kribbella qitaiheensis TaxID=1544730 RepID=UPI003620B573
MTTTPPQPPQNPYPAQPPAEGYGPPPVQPGQFPQYGPPHEQQPNYGEQYADPQYGGQQQFQQPGQQFAPGQQGQYQQQGTFPQDHAAQGQFPQGQFMPVAQDTLQCRFCGGMPAVQATVRGHQGLIILMRFLKLEGPFCRTCGVATIRDMTAKSMWQGWWGIGSMIVNPIMMLVNLGTYSKFKNLPEPAPGAPGRPMDPGKPLFKRPVVLGLLLPIALIAAIVIGNLGNPSSADAGDCVQNKGTVADPNVKVVDCGSTDAEFKVLGKLSSTANSDECEQFPGYTVAYTESRGSSGYTLCLGPN